MVQDADTGTGQQLKDYLADWDKPDQTVMAEKGVTELEVWAVKNGLSDAGFDLQYPAPPESRDHWHKWNGAI